MAGPFKNKVQAAAAGVMPDQLEAQQHRTLAEHQEGGAKHEG